MWFVVSAGVAHASALLSDPDATTRRQVTKRARFRPTCHIPQKASFYQDRIGTSIGKSTPKRQIAVFPLSSTQAWQAIQDAWRGAEEPAAAVLNAISGWRLSMNKRRAEASGVPVHFLGALKIFKTVFSSRFVASTKASLFKFTQTRSRQATALMTQQRQSNPTTCFGSALANRAGASQQPHDAGDSRRDDGRRLRRCWHRAPRPQAPSASPWCDTNAFWEPF